MTTGNPSNFLKDDSVTGQLDLDDEYVTESWLLEQYVGNNLFGQGYNPNGGIGNGNTTSFSSPIQIGSLTNWKQIAQGYGHTKAIKTDGTLWSWGQDGYIGASLSPVQVGTSTNWRQIACSGTTFALTNQGALYYFQTSSPTQIGSLTNWKSISSSRLHQAAIKTDGTLWTWDNSGSTGNNSYGELGLGNTNEYSSPVQVGSLTNWKQVQTFHYHTLAIKTDNTLWAWGRNTEGQLGLGDTTNRSSPVQVGSLNDWKQLPVGCGFATYFSAVIKTDGTLWTSGYNSSGQLGLGNTTGRSTFTQVGNSSNWKQVCCGQYGMSATKTDGTAWSWGDNGTGGELGLGDQVNRSSPTQIGTMTIWKQAALGTSVMHMTTFNDIGL
jgi:alpha-tubulin suppressor-like RCC1 family protein